MGIGTEASEYSRMAPSLILGPGDIDVVHKPAESISIRELQEAVGIYERIAKELPHCCKDRAAIIRVSSPKAGDPVTTEGCVWHGHGPSQSSVTTECPFAWA